ncbi:hypothetical protein L598_001400000610 [Mesorhizobium sp. J18]|uniref:helix-turn-helix domain-containing protein n=1 Tax=Mesorhizobium sp. J18 TaxID=935263 RepID=UPI001199DF5A|nr:helix-turn-helix transcriptional regulator [Mesorhizobium sp. J18]TWG99523.1 hypothetical protein L598_001400000610 [Mesorhizobium sp. J18]
MTSAHKIFAANLREACSTRASISQVCREIGVNRQQFNRYINGQALPSAHNRHRIARAFAVEPEDFDLPRQEFRKRLGPCVSRDNAGDILLDGYPGDLNSLRRYLGFYQTYHLSMSWPGKVVCSCVHLKERDGRVVVTSRERIIDRASGIRQHSRYVGLAAYRRNRIFITERTNGEYPTFGQTILMPFEIHQRLYLHGITMGVSWRKENTPYASRMIWRYFGHDVDRRALVSRCGLLAPESGVLPEPVSRYLTGSNLLTVSPSA